MSQLAYQRCRRCGTDEAEGDYCTWCRTAAYDLVVHLHLTNEGRPGRALCPLGTYRNPGPVLDDKGIRAAEEAIASNLAHLATLDLTGYAVVHHPEAPRGDRLTPRPAAKAPGPGSEATRRATRPFRRQAA